MTEQTGTTALVKREVGGVLIPEIITDAREFNAAVDQWRGSKHFNLLCPVLHLSTIPPSHEITVAEVQINPDPKNGGDCYNNPLFCERNEVALSLVGLSKIAQAAGMSTSARRVDSGHVQFYWEYEATAEYLGFDGTPIRITRSKEWDLRDGSFRLKGFSAKQIEQARANGQANAESRAVNRSIRQYGIKQKFLQAEVERPFLIARLRWVPDMENPVVAAMVTQMRLGGVSKLFANAVVEGAQQKHLPPAGAPVDLATTPPALRPVAEAKGSDVFPTEDEPTPPASEKPEVTYRVKGAWFDSKSATPRWYIKTEETGDQRLYVERQDMAEGLKDLWQQQHLIVISTERRGDEAYILEVGDGGERK